MTKENGDNLFLPIAPKCMESGTDDDDETYLQIYISCMFVHSFIHIEHLAPLQENILRI